MNDTTFVRDDSPSLQYLTSGGWMPLVLDSRVARYAGAVMRCGIYAMRPEEYDRQAALPEPTVRTVVHVGTITDPEFVAATEEQERLKRARQWADAAARRPVVAHDYALAA